MRKIHLVILALTITAMVIIFSCQHDDLSLWNENYQLKQAEKEAVSEAVIQKVDDQIDVVFNWFVSLSFIT